jgi:hypothetical protein
MEFKVFEKLLQENFEKASQNASKLFEVDLDKDVLWNLYLDSFPAGTNEIYRKRREFDCSCCRHFIRNMGNVVFIDANYDVKTIWDFETGDAIFQPVINVLDAYVKSKTISDVYVSKLKTAGTLKSLDMTDGPVIEWNHFYLELPQKFLNGERTLSDGTLKGAFRDQRNVFKRSLDEITNDSLLTVLELIGQNSLYKGEEWGYALRDFFKLKKEYDKLTPQQQENYAWAKSVIIGGAVGKIRNHSIGTLLVNISEGMDLDAAMGKYEAIVAPTNYKRPKAIFTPKMLEDAKKQIENLGYLDSLNRRYATLDDITVNNILFSNKDAAKRISGTKGIFDSMLSDAVSDPKKFSRIEEVPVDDFVCNVLPNVKELEVYLENRHSGNLVSLIAPEDPAAPSMFKWSNAFSWAYSGNITDSDIKERVKTAGGKVDGVLRFSIQWNDGKEHDENDLDAHCVEPNGREIYYAMKLDSRTGGQLDIDIIGPRKGVPAVENTTWPNKSIMPVGDYYFFVRCYTNRGGRNGFKAEIEFDGHIFQFDYPKEVRHGEDVRVAKVTLNANGEFSIQENFPSSSSAKEVWNLKTNQFVPVSVVMFSPNYWNGESGVGSVGGVGNRHYFFMLKDCVNPEKPNGFYNEFLKEDLLKQKHVFEALGARMAVKDVADQLSGLGFASTKRGELIVKVKGQTERLIKIKF